LYIFVVISPGFNFVFSLLAKRLAGVAGKSKSISKMTSVNLSTQSISVSIATVYATFRRSQAIAEEPCKAYCI